MTKTRATRFCLWTWIGLLCYGCSEPAETTAGKLRLRELSPPKLDNDSGVVSGVSVDYSGHGNQLVVTRNTKEGPVSLTWSQEIQVVQFPGSADRARRFALGQMNLDAFYLWGIGNIGSPAASDNGSHLLWVSPRLVSDRSLEVVDLATGAAVNQVKWDTGSRITAVQFSPDGDFLAICGSKQVQTSNGIGFSDGVVRLWHVATGELVLKHDWPEGEYCTLAFDPSGKFLVVGGGELFGTRESSAISVFDLGSRTLRDSVKQSGQPVRCVRMTPDGQQLLSSAADGVLTCWDMSEGSPAIVASQTLASTPATINHLSITPDGAVVFAAIANFNRGQKSGELHVLEAASLKPLAVLLNGHAAPVASATVSPDGQTLVALDAYGKVFAWEIRPVEPDSSK